MPTVSNRSAVACLPPKKPPNLAGSRGCPDGAYARFLSTKNRLAALYYVWTGIHLAADVGGTDGESYIYSVIDWEDNPGFTAALMCVGLFIGAPIFVCLVRVVFYVRGSRRVPNSDGLIRVTEF